MDTPYQIETEYLGITEAAEYLRVSASTLRRWEKKGFLIPERTPTGIRRYTRQQLDDVLNNPQQLQHDDSPESLAKELHSHFQDNSAGESVMPPAEPATSAPAPTVPFVAPPTPLAYTSPLVSEHPPESFTISTHRASPPPLSELNHIENISQPDEDLSSYITYTDQNHSSDLLQHKVSSLTETYAPTSVLLNRSSVESEDQTLPPAPSPYSPPINPPKYSSLFHEQDLSDGKPHPPVRNAFTELHTFSGQHLATTDYTVPQPVESTYTVDDAAGIASTAEDNARLHVDHEVQFSDRHQLQQKKHAAFIPVLIYLAVFLGVFIVALGVWFIVQTFLSAGQQELLRPVVR